MVDVGAQPFLSNPSGLWGKEIKSHMVSTWESVISVAPHDSLLFPTSSPERKKKRKKEGMNMVSSVHAFEHSHHITYPFVSLPFFTSRNGSLDY